MPFSLSISSGKSDNLNLVLSSLFAISRIQKTVIFFQKTKVSIFSFIEPIFSTLVKNFLPQKQKRDTRIKTLHPIISNTISKMHGHFHCVEVNVKCHESYERCYYRTERGLLNGCEFLILSCYLLLLFYIIRCFIL